MGGGGVLIYSGSARLVSFEIKLISKEASRAEPEYMNIQMTIYEYMNMQMTIYEYLTQIQLGLVASLIQFKCMKYFRDDLTLACL